MMQMFGWNLLKTNWMHLNKCGLQLILMVIMEADQWWNKSISFSSNGLISFKTDFIQNLHLINYPIKTYFTKRILFLELTEWNIVQIVILWRNVSLWRLKCLYHIVSNICRWENKDWTESWVYILGHTLLDDRPKPYYRVHLIHWCAECDLFHRASKENWLDFVVIEEIAKLMMVELNQCSHGFHFE